MTRRAGVALLAMIALGAGVPPLARSLASEISEAGGDTPQPSGEPRSQEAMPIRVVEAVPSTSYQVRKAYTGALVAARRSRLAFERPGKVVSLAVDEGARVDAGAELATLDRRRLNASRKAVAAELAEAQAVLAELIEGPRKETIATAAAEVRSLAAQRDVADRNLKRAEQLVNTRAISIEEYDQNLYATKVAEARVDAAQKQLEELETGTRVEKLDAQRARVEALEARLEDVDRELEDTVLDAPFAGSIVRRHVDEGAIVAAGERVFDLIEDTRLEAWIGVPVASAGRLTVGEEIAVAIDNRDYRATVKSLRSELDPTTRTQNVVLSISPDEEGRLVAGQVARILIGETVTKDGFWVPASALTPHRRGLWAVYVVEGDGAGQTIASRDVELIYTEGGRSYVRGTLEPGERIVVAGGHKVVSGQRVAVATPR